MNTILLPTAALLFAIVIDIMHCTLCLLARYAFFRGPGHPECEPMGKSESDTNMMLDSNIGHGLFYTPVEESTPQLHRVFGR